MNQTAVLVLDVEPGDSPDVDYLRSEAGSWYRVVESRQVRSKIHPHRFRFEVDRLGHSKPLDVLEGEVFEDVEVPKVIHFYWYDRG